MPSIDWIGKAAVERHHLEIPYRLVHCNGKLSAGDVAAGNLLVQGDNLEALRAILPYYAGGVKCVYIDPPYNTGNEKWAYNDRVNSPEIQHWLGKIVGSEAEDLCRHDKWLCMMYPRLRLLREFLREDGVIFVSIDDNEVHHLRMLMNEIFGENNFVASFVWRKKYGGGKGARFFVDMHEYILCFARSINSLSKFSVARTEKQESIFSEKDSFFSERGKYYIRPLKSGLAHRANLIYPIKCPDGSIVKTQWICAADTFRELQKSGRIVFKKLKTGRYNVYKKFYEKDNEDGVLPESILYDLAYNQNAKEEIKLLFGIKEGRDIPFENAKPVNLLSYILKMIGDKNALVMDSYAGSGTTAHAVLQQNKEDGGNRRFVLVEMDKKISETITAKRIRKAIVGYKSDNSEIASLGGGFRFCTLGVPLFDANGNIGKTVKFGDLAAHIFFSETGKPIPKRPRKALIGEDEGRAFYLLYNGIMGDKRRDGGNMLTSKTLAKLPKSSVADIQRVVFAEGTLLSAERLAREKVDFRQIPYKIRMR